MDRTKKMIIDRTKGMTEEERIKYYEDLIDQNDIVETYEELLPDGSIDLRITLRPMKKATEAETEKEDQKLEGCKIAK